MAPNGIVRWSDKQHPRALARADSTAGKVRGKAGRLERKTCCSVTALNLWTLTTPFELSPSGLQRMKTLPCRTTRAKQLKRFPRLEDATKRRIGSTSPTFELHLVQEFGN
ncbi:hypothetical protein ACROYT_G012566 [Oculina patagonica]